MKWLPLIALVVGGMALVFREEGSTIAGLDEEQFASLLIGGTLVAFLGTSILAGYRGRLGTAVKHFAAWTLIVFGLVTGCTYKAEVVEIAHRITGELMPPGEVQNVEPRHPGEQAVRIRRRADGHFVARVKIAGVAMTALVDTGASTVVLRAADAKAIGIDIDRLSYTVPVQTANGLAYAAAVRLTQVAVGPIN